MIDIQHKNSNRGFSLIETIVGIAILLIGITPPLLLVYRTLQATEIARDQVIATYLAEEGMEYVRFVRDTNVLHGNAWLNKLNVCSNGTPCDINDIMNNPISGPSPVKNCSGDPCSALEFDTATGRYVSSGGDYETIFHRSITIDDTTYGPDEADVIVDVNWQPRIGSAKTTTLKEHLFNWTGL